MNKVPILAFAFVLALTPATAHQQHQALPQQTSAFTEETLMVPDVTLIDQNGQRHRLKGALTEDRVIVLNFGYSNCETICPLGNAVLADLQDLLPEDGSVRLLSITIDPATDTPDRMRQTAEDFDAGPDWFWLTGAPAEVDRLLAAFDADYANLSQHDPMFLVGRLSDGQFYRSLTMPTPEELKRIIDAKIH